MTQKEIYQKVLTRYGLRPIMNRLLNTTAEMNEAVHELNKIADDPKSTPKEREDALLRYTKKLAKLSISMDLALASGETLRNNVSKHKTLQLSRMDKIIKTIEGKQ